MTITTSILDNFNRANGDPGANWTNDPFAWGANSWAIASNALAFGGVVDQEPLAAWDAATFGPDCEVYCTITNPPDSAGWVFVGLIMGALGSTTTEDGYTFSWSGGQLKIERIDDAIGTTLGATVAQTLSIGHKMGLRRSGGTLEGWYDSGSGWELKLTRTDSTYIGAAYLIVGGGLGASDTLAIDDFGGGTISVSVDSCLPDADITTTGWTSTPLFSKVNDASDATVIQATAA